MNLQCRLKIKKGTDYGYLSLLVYHNKVQKEISLGRKIKVKDWDDKIQLPKGDQFKMLNIQIRNLKRDISSLIDEFEARKQKVDLDYITKKIMSPDESVEFMNEVKKIPTIAEFIHDFITNNNENIRLASLDPYRTFKKSIEKFNGQILISELNVEYVNNFYKFLVDQKYESETIATRMSNLRKVSNLALQAKYITEYPFGKGRHTIKREVNLKRKFLNDIEIEKFLSFDPKTNSELRVLQIVKFNIHCGLRISDLLTLRHNEIISEERQARSTMCRVHKLTGKTKTTVVIPLSNQALNVLKSLVGNTFDENHFVFPFLENKEYNEKTLKTAISSKTAYINKVLASICKQLNIKHISTHCLRHTFATSLLNKNVNINTISKVLAHKSLNTTQIYAQLIQSTIDSELSVLNK